MTDTPFSPAESAELRSWAEACHQFSGDLTSSGPRTGMVCGPLELLGMSLNSSIAVTIPHDRRPRTWPLVRPASDDHPDAGSR